MSGVRKTPVSGGKYQGWFINAAGRRTHFTGTRNRKQTQQMADRFEDDHRQVRLGYRPAPSSAQKQRVRPCKEVMDEYLAWGEAQGGRGGRPWSKLHARTRRKRLAWWRQTLGLKTLADIEGVLPRVEAALRRWQTEGKAGKTLANQAEALAAWCDWCVRRGFLAADPLAAMARFDTTPRVRRRALTPEEITRVLAAAPAHHRLLLETALVSGLRVQELRSLSHDHLDVERGGLKLQAEWTKNRKPGFQPLPRALIQRLQYFGETGEAKRLYKRHGTRRVPARPLLFVPSQPARVLDACLEAVGIPKNGPEGKLDFHACRTAFINLVLDSGALLKDAQELARHSTADMTLNVYGRAREDRMAEAVERIGEKVLLNSEMPECVTCVSLPVAGSETENATPWASEDCVSCKLVAAEGIESGAKYARSRHQRTWRRHNLHIIRTLAMSSRGIPNRSATPPAQPKTLRTHPQIVPSLHRLSPLT